MVLTAGQPHALVFNSSVFKGNIQSIAYAVGLRLSKSKFNTSFLIQNSLLESYTYSKVYFVVRNSFLIAGKDKLDPDLVWRIQQIRIYAFMTQDKKVI